MLPHRQGNGAAGGPLWGDSLSCSQTGGSVELERPCRVLNNGNKIDDVDDVGIGQSVSGGGRAQQQGSAARVGVRSRWRSWGK